jgi:hypothetical protein
VFVREPLHMSIPKPKGVAPLPERLPGAFFLLEYDRTTQRYTLRVDDDDATSYNLGSDIQAIMLRFRLWGHKDLGDRALDLAREFGAAQAIPGEDRVLALFNRTSDKKLDWSKEGTKYGGYLPAVGE